MRAFFIVFLLAGCGDELPIALDADPAVPDAGVMFDADTTDADPLAPDAFVADAAVPVSDATVVVYDAAPPPDATPPIDWAGYHSINIIEGASTCGNFPTPDKKQDMLRIPVGFPANDGYIFKYNPNNPLDESMSGQGFKWTPVGDEININLADCMTGSCDTLPFTTMQTGLDTWTGSFVRHENAGFGNPNAPCDYNYTIVGTKL